MTDSSPARALSPLQRELLEQFFARESRFTLTGGAALAGYYFGHRETRDLDLFAEPGPDLEEVARTLQAAAAACGASLKSVRKGRSFNRFLAERGEERCVVDLVIDPTERVDLERPSFGAVRVDSLREIAANKVGALLGRAEIRDLVDLKAIARAGGDLRQAMRDAERKDAGADPATLAWVLDELTIGETASLPGGISPDELETFRKEFIRLLRAMALERARRDPSKRGG
jgi:hypothetical protein